MIAAVSAEIPLALLSELFHFIHRRKIQFLASVGDGNALVGLLQARADNDADFEMDDVDEEVVALGG